MKRYTQLLLALLLLIPATADAQRRKKPVKKTAPKKEEVVEEDPRIQQMLASTQKIMFVDSMVVDFDDFISYIPLSPECGVLTQDGLHGGYTNELNDRRLMATVLPGDSVCHILSSNLIDTEWTTPATLNGIDDDASDFPYLMPDGTTLYFAQRGDKSIGGYDIFVTRYDAERNMFLRPENLGMPFSSEANDYLYVIDETYQIGYFVTDRRQPRGKVCIYIFLPPNSRNIYPSEAYSEQQLRALAGINRIADTWGRDDASRRNLSARLEEARANQHQASQPANASFHTPHSAEIDALRQQASNLESVLQNLRTTYARASTNERESMRDDILRKEQQHEELQLTIRQKIKELHNKQHHE